MFGPVRYRLGIGLPRRAAADIHFEVDGHHHRDYHRRICTLQLEEVQIEAAHTSSTLQVLWCARVVSAA